MIARSSLSSPMSSLMRACACIQSNWVGFAKMHYLAADVSTWSARVKRSWPCLRQSVVKLGGGSKTSCLIGDENSVLGSGSAGGSNFVRAGESHAKESLAAAIRQACMVANVKPSEIVSTCAGMAGVVSSETADTMRRILSEIVPGEAEIVGDN